MKKKDILRLLESYTDNEDINPNELQEEIEEKSNQFILNKIYDWSKKTIPLIQDILNNTGYIVFSNKTKIILDKQDNIHFSNYSEGYEEIYDKDDLLNLYVVLFCGLSDDYFYDGYDEIADNMGDVEEDILNDCEKLHKEIEIIKWAFI